MVTIDYASFPHIVEQIVELLPPQDCAAVRATCRSLRDLVDSIPVNRRDHVVLKYHSQWHYSMRFLDYPSGEPVPGVRLIYDYDPAIYGHQPYKEENWQTDKEVLKNLNVVDVDGYLDLERVEEWTRAGYDFRPKILRIENSDLGPISRIAHALTTLYLSNVDENIIPLPGDLDNGLDGLEKSPFHWLPQPKHIDLIKLHWAQTNHLVITIFLYGDCRPYTPKLTAESYDLETVTVIFIHKGDSKYPRSTDRPPADGLGILASLIDRAAGWYRMTTFTFVGLAEHAIQLGVVDTPMSVAEMHAHVAERIEAAQVRMGISEDSDKGWVSAIMERRDFWDFPPIQVFTHDEYRRQVGRYTYSLNTFQDWAKTRHIRHSEEWTRRHWKEYETYDNARPI